MKRTTDRTVFSTDCVIEETRFRYEIDAQGGLVSERTTRTHSRHIRTMRDGKSFGFAEAFRLVEGEEIFQRVLDGRDVSVDEKSWIASKLEG